MNSRWTGFRKDIWLWILVAVGLMSGIAATFREWLSIFHPKAADAGKVFDACLITCFLVAAILVFARQRSAIVSLENGQKSKDAEKAKVQQLHVLLGEYMVEGEALAREWRAGMRDYGPWLQRERQ